MLQLCRKLEKCPAKRHAATDDKLNLAIWMELHVTEETASGSTSKGEFQSNGIAEETGKTNNGVREVL